MHVFRSHFFKRTLIILAVAGLLAGVALSFYVSLYVLNPVQARTTAAPAASENIITDTRFRASENFLEADIQSFLDKQPGPLKIYRETVAEGIQQSAARSLAAYSLTAQVNPKVLLAFLELKSKLLSTANPPQSTLDFAFGFDTLDYKGFSNQLKSTARILSDQWSAYDGKRNITFKDGSNVPASPLINRGSYAVQAALALTADPATGGTLWQTEAGLGEGSFYAVYKSYFGDPLTADTQAQPAATPVVPTWTSPVATATAKPSDPATGQKTLETYLALLNDRDSMVRQSAINGLGQLGAKEAVPPLLGLLSDPDKAVRTAASQALLALGAKEQTVTAWLNLLADRNPDIRQGASVGLRELGDLQTITNLNPFLTNSDQAVRQVAGEVRTYLKIKLLALNVALGSHE